MSLACSHVTSGGVVTLKDMVTTNPAPPPPPERGLCRNQQSAARVNRAATAHTRQRKGDTSRHSIVRRVPVQVMRAGVMPCVRGSCGHPCCESHQTLAGGLRHGVCGW
ncbi:MAG: hypothetical protein KAT13_05595 [Methanosarcinales archaeon]|nr:hypothetical protein [Methanosarcinales archaeon]